MAKFKKGMKRPEGAGRTKGTPNKTTSQLRELARLHAADMIDIPARLAAEADSDAARITAIKELLDRGYGKSTALHEVMGQKAHRLCLSRSIVYRCQIRSNRRRTLNRVVRALHPKLNVKRFRNLCYG